MRKAVSLCALLMLLLLPSIALVSYAHPGRTDSRGGHTDRSTGDYHYHHGYSAHDHYDMDGDGDIDCPYDFEDKTGRKSSSGKSKKKDPPLFGGLIAVGLYVFFMFILPSIMTK